MKCECVSLFPPDAHAPKKEMALAPERKPYSAGLLILHRISLRKDASSSKLRSGHGADLRSSCPVRSDPRQGPWFFQVWNRGRSGGQFRRKVESRLENIEEVRNRLISSEPSARSHRELVSPSELPVGKSRQDRVREALFRGGTLSLDNPRYLETVRTLTDELLRVDLEPTDLTIEALSFGNRPAEVRVVARESGVVAGLEEAAWLYTRFGLSAERLKADGECVEPNQVLLQIRGDCGNLLRLERTSLNLIQRMSGIATATRRLQEFVQSCASGTFVVATRKTAWGLLDKRAVHLGGGGTHRLGLGDAILVKNNHLLFFGHKEKEEEAVSLALRRAWPLRRHAAFLEVEVTGLAGALAAGRTFRELQQANPDSCPCLLMLDNVKPDEVAKIVATLRAEELWDHVLIEVSGKISGTEIEAYAACGVDAISVGALTHSCQVLDLHARMEPKAR